MKTDSSILVIETAKSLGQPTVNELVEQLVAKKGFKKNDATKAVYVEYKKGTLNLSNVDPPSNLAGYFVNLENAWFWAVTALVAMTIVVVFTVNTSPLLYVRYVLGGVFVLFMPGFLLVSALYTRNDEMEMMEKGALSVGLSLAIVPLMGLVLNYTPWGIRLEPVVVSLGLFSEIMAVVCVVRRFRYFRLSFQ